MHEGNYRAWLIWFTAGLFYLFEFIHRIAIRVLIPELSDSFQVSMSIIGGLSAYYFYAYAFAQIPVGLLIDRYGSRNVLSISCLMIAAGSLMFGLTRDINVARLCRLLIGFGSASAFVGCLKLAAGWFPANKFGLIVGLTNFLGASGAMIGGSQLAVALESHSWRNIMQLSTVV